MKPKFTTRIWHFALLLAGLPAFLPAQNRTQGFTYDKDKEGSFKIFVSYYRAQDPNDAQYAGPNGEIDLKGSESGKLQFTLYTNEIKFEKNSHRDDYVIIIRPYCHKGTSELKDPPGNVELEFEKNRREKTIEYEIRGEGSGELKIGFDVVKNRDRDDENAPSCLQTISFPYTVSGMPDKSIKACEQAWAAFKNDKFSSIEKLRRVKRDYPNAACMDKIDRALAQYALWKQADDAYKTDCKKAKDLCATYTREFPNGDYAAEMANIAKCTGGSPPPPPTIKPPKPGGTPLPAKSPEEQDFEKIKNSTDLEAVQAFVNKWGTVNPGSRFVIAAQEKLASNAPIIQYEEKLLSDGRREFRLLNAVRPQIKDMSLYSGLQIETDRLESENVFTAKPGKSGEYIVNLKDAQNKRAILKISNNFGASLTPQPGGSAWLLRVNGRNDKSLKISLKDLENTGNKNITWKGGWKFDTLTITQAELEQRKCTSKYIVVVEKISDLSAKPLEAGIIESGIDDGGSALIDTIMFVLLMFVILCAAYGLYLLLGNKRASTRKQTIYDRIQ